jgi:hypothetical protein
MKKLLFGIIVGLVAGGTGVWLYLHFHHEEAKKEEEKKEEPHVQRDENDKVFLKLDAEAQAHADLKMAVLEAAELKPELKAFGRVIDPASLATALHDIASARAQIEASSKEAARLKTLFAQNQNASARALETAEATLKRDELLSQAAELRLVTTWGKAIANHPDLATLVQALVSQEAALVRVEVPASEKLEGTPTAARLALLSAPHAPAPAEFIGAALTADPQTLGRGFFLLAKEKALPGNAPAITWLTLPGEPQKGVVVPREAIVRHEGEAFVYVQTTDETFERFEIALQHPLPAGWFSDELKPGVKVVINGAQQLLSEELKGEGGGE